MWDQSTGGRMEKPDFEAAMATMKRMRERSVQRIAPEELVCTVEDFKKVLQKNEFAAQASNPSELAVFGNVCFAGIKIRTFRTVEECVCYVIEKNLQGIYVSLVGSDFDRLSQTLGPE